MFRAFFSQGLKVFELTNDLGNVLATISDKKIAVSSPSNSSLIDHYEADVVSAQDYYPLGMQMPGRTSASSLYRYGFNGKERDVYTSSSTTYDYGFRIYNPSLGRFLSVDPLTKEYPWNSPYTFAENDVISSIDLDGLEKLTVINNRDKYGRLKSMVMTGIRNKETKQAVNQNMKFANKKDVTTKDVLIINKQEGKADQLGYENISSNYSRQIAKARTLRNLKTDNTINIPDGAEGAVANDARFNNQLLRGEAAYDEAQYEIFYSEQKFILSRPVEYLQGAYIFSNARGNARGNALDVNQAANTIKSFIDLITKEFNQANPEINSTITEVTLTGGILSKEELKIRQKALKEQFRINAKIVIDKNFKTDVNSNDPGLDYKIDVKISGVKL